MNLPMIPRLALKALAQNKLRTGLTMLGIIIGVGAVICVGAIGEGASGLGVGLGALGARAIANSFEWPARVSTSAIGVAFMFSAEIGVFFGYYPARQTARLDPIEALRSE